MPVALQLEKMNTAEKLRALEEIWDDLCRADDAVPSPEWHREVLDAREHRIRKGLTTFISLDEAKHRSRDQVV